MLTQSIHCRITAAQVLCSSISSCYFYQHLSYLWIPLGYTSSSLASLEEYGMYDNKFAGPDAPSDVGLVALQMPAWFALLLGALVLDGVCSAALTSNCFAAGNQCWPPSDSAKPQTSYCGCASLTAITITGYKSLNSLTHYASVNSVNGNVAIQSDTNLTSLAGLEVRSF